MLVADVTTNHAASFCVTQQRITSNGKCTVTVFQPTNTWNSATISCTVLYAKAPFIVSREYI